MNRPNKCKRCREHPQLLHKHIPCRSKIDYSMEDYIVWWVECLGGCDRRTDEYRREEDALNEWNKEVNR